MHAPVTLQPAGPVAFGVFDHLDDAGRPLAELYEGRLQLAQAYEAAGLAGYHVAEHHATPLGMSPSPSVFLAALAQRTRTLKFGPLVYTLALHHPLRLAEEICMLDQLSRGRLQLGIGRGISPYEVAYFGGDPEETQARYLEAWAVVRAALECGATGTTLTHAGRFYSYRDVPLPLAPLQRPHPPLWYGLGNPAAIDWCVANRVHVVSNAPLGVVREATDRYRAAWAAAGHAPATLPFLGTTRHAVLAASDGQAMDRARRAYRRWHASFMFLWRRHAGTPLFARFPDEIDPLVDDDHALVGSPATVRAALARQVAASGVNYVLLRFAFGDLSTGEALESLGHFAEAVQPAFGARTDGTQA